MKRLSVLVPVLTLAGCAVAWIVERSVSRELEPIRVHAQSNIALGQIRGPTHAGSIDARVVDASEAPVREALVWLRAGNEPHWTYTDDDGAFQLGSLGDGPWPTTIVARGYTPLRMELSAAAGTQRIDVGAPLPPTPRFDPVPRTALVGRLAAPLRRDFAGVEIVLVPARELAERSGSVPRRALADAQGAFTIEEVDHGPYTVRVRPEWARGGTWPDLLTALDDPRAHAILHEPEASPQELVLEVASSEVHGVLASTDGSPLEGALVLVTPAADAMRVWPPISSDAEGRFVARDLPAGEYRIAVRAGAASAEALVKLGPSESRAVGFAPLDVR